MSYSLNPEVASHKVESFAIRGRMSLLLIDRPS